ncbi:hypothetical protein J1N35_007296 [Gossypium stocksii]|uniref:Aldehyde dehydrogenase domain-containing protein n=1 Tax=Gossypium stocksii TaxID=47602 RepID=A0A9D3W780_9ROSI|nr:hypothetical protein J1N35_007296 [Gossypium stocksii]
MHSSNLVKNLPTLRPQVLASASPCFSTATESSFNHRNPSRVPNLIGGAFIDSKSTSTIDVINPATQEVVSQISLTTNEEFKAAAAVAKQAFPSWRNTPITTRQRIMFKLQELILRDMVKHELSSAKALELFVQDLCDHTYEIAVHRGAKTMNSLHLDPEKIGVVRGRICSGVSRRFG